MQRGRTNGILLDSTGSEFERQIETTDSYAALPIGDNWQPRPLYACNGTSIGSLQANYLGAVYWVENAVALTNAIMSSNGSASGVARVGIYQQSDGAYNRGSLFPLVDTFDLALPTTGADQVAVDFSLLKGFCLIIMGLASGTSPSQVTNWINADLGPMNQVSEVLTNAAMISFITTHSAGSAPPANLNMKNGAGDVTPSVSNFCASIINFSEST